MSEMREQLEAMRKAQAETEPHWEHRAVFATLTLPEALSLAEIAINQADQLQAKVMRLEAVAEAAKDAEGAWNLSVGPQQSYDDLPSPLRRLTESLKALEVEDE